MQTERFVIEELGGLNTNLVEGLGKQPDVLRNAAFTRMGGYEFWGETEEYTNLGDLNWPTITDDTGFGIYGTNLFFRGITPATTLPFTPGFSLPYTSVNRLFNVYYREGPTFWTNAPTPADITDTSDFEITKQDQTPSGDLPLGEYRFWAIDYVESVNGRILYGPSSVRTIDLTGGEAGWRIDLDLSTTAGFGRKLIYVRYRDTSGSVTPPLEGRTGFIWDSRNGGQFSIRNLSNIQEVSHIFIRMPNNGLSEYHQSRFYTSAANYLPATELASLDWNEVNCGPGFLDGAPSLTPGALIPTGLRVYYTELGYANMTRTLNYFDVPFAASRTITGLASTPAGLLIFGSNETFLFRGDPAAGPELQRFSSSYGMDSGTRPAKMAGIVGVIYAGELYVISLGMGDVDFGGAVQNVSREVYDRQDPIIQVVPDHARNVFICRFQSGRILRYHVAMQRWSEDPFSTTNLNNVSLLIPNADVYGGPVTSPYYYRPNIVAARLNRVLHVGEGTMTFGWRNIDLGDKRASKLWRAVEIYTNEGYDGQPVMTWSIGEDTGVVSGRNKGRGIWVFTLPLGQTAPTATLIFTFPEMDPEDVVEPPVVIAFVPRGRERIRWGPPPVTVGPV